LFKKFKDLLFILNCIFLLGLILIVNQDFKNREVSILLFLVIGIVGGYLHYKTQYLNVFLLSLLINFSTILILVFILLIYTKFVLKMELKETIGLGDLFFFMVLAISFPTISFMMLFSMSFVFSLILFLVLKTKMKNKTVPLAGLQALFLGLVILINLLFNFVNLYAI
tara:strand:+ start:543 stop:1046 length:504 start_codon:yes stop_codon:yes gene_type:complete